MIGQNQDQVGLRDFLTVLFKHKLKIIMIFLLVASAAVVISFTMTPVYEAKSTILVNVGREYIYHPDEADKTGTVLINQEETINSEINILTTTELIEAVVNTFKVENIYPELLEPSLSTFLQEIGLSTKLTPFQAAVIKFEKKLNVEAVKKSTVIEVSYQHSDPQIAAKAVALLVELYKRKHFQVQIGEQASLLQQQVADHALKLKESETELEQFKGKNRVYSLDEQKSLLLQQRMELDTDLKTTSNQIMEMEEKLSSLRAQMKIISDNKDRYTNSERDKIITDAKAKLLDLQLKKQDLLQKYKETNVLVVNIRKEIDLVTDFLRDQEEAIAGKVNSGNVVYQEAERTYLQAKTDLDSKIAKAGGLTRQLVQVDSEIQSLDQKEKQIQELKRNVEINDKNYRTYIEKLEGARISDDMNRQRISNISIIQAATVSAKPVKPKKVLYILLGIALGALSAVGYAFLTEYTSQAFSSPEGAESKLRLPVLATVAYKK